MLEHKSGGVITSGRFFGMSNRSLFGVLKIGTDFYIIILFMLICLFQGDYWIVFREIIFKLKRFSLFLNACKI